MSIDTSANGFLKFLLPERMYRGSAWQPEPGEFTVAESGMNFVAGMRISGSIFFMWCVFFAWFLTESKMSFSQAMITTGIIWFAFVLVLAKRLTTWKTSRFYVTNRRLWCFSGFWSLKETSVALNKIHQLSYSQSPLGRRFGYGTLKFTDDGGRKVKIRGISDISDFARNVSEYSTGTSPAA